MKEFNLNLFEAWDALDDRESLSYEELGKILSTIKDNWNDISAVKRIEQGIPTKLTFSGPRRACQFYNSHVFEETIKNTTNDALLRKFAQLLLDKAKMYISESDYVNIYWPSIDEIKNSMRINYHDNTHNSFHSGRGNYAADLEINCNLDIKADTGQYDLDDQIIWDTLSFPTVKLELKIFYQEKENLSSILIYDANYILVLDYYKNKLSLYNRKWEKISEFNNDIVSGLFDPNDFSNSW